jgi:hypothetical protein
MPGMNAIQRDEANYNYSRFPRYVLWADALRTVHRHGIWPGEPAPDFELPLPTGEYLRLSQMRGRPVLLHFGSYT